MSNSKKAAKNSSAGQRVGKLSEDQIKANFSEMHPPLSASQAYIEAGRCYFCYDAPCTTACPTGIDIPEFIKRIQTGNTKGSARKILQQNIMGGMCARVCPTEVLCEAACVRNTHEGKPVAIGLLQRYATDEVIEKKVPLFERLMPTDKKVAVIGAGPAGMSCAHRLAAWGHNVTVFDKNEKAGGLNEYGIAAYKALNDIAQKEVEYILEIGGIVIKPGVRLGVDFTLDKLREEYDAVFMAIGLAGVNRFKIAGEAVDGVLDAVNYIHDLRQAERMSQLPVGDKVVVIGGGMTAIDIAVQSKKLGASEVTIVYRRDKANMKASEHEQQYAQINDVKLRYCSKPNRVLSKDGQVTGIEFEVTELDPDGNLSETGKTYQLEADVLFKAIGQTLSADQLGDSASSLTIESGRIAVNDVRKTSLDNVWAGGDCVSGGEDLTVSAVQDGKLAAQSIHEYLQSA
ncbi:NAD-dependent dihydropyrimidine dehydrogenase subunit PreT (EC [Olavius sp. associated proteobacterium Delta 1]|nr:NAD-dependent dihydropyrimidine dehydrogenase subunit PreT (EC [Olavius sp. associated proteobacterium Delta 1]